MSVQEDLQSIIARVTHMSTDELYTARLLKEIKADSLHWIQIIIGIETMFNIEIDIVRLKQLNTLGDLVEHIKGLAKQSA